MRLFILAVVVAMLNACQGEDPHAWPANIHDIRLPDIPIPIPEGFYHLKLLTAMVGQSAAADERGNKIQVSLVIRVVLRGEEADMIIRDTAARDNCEQLTFDYVGYYPASNGYSVGLRDTISNSEGQKYRIRWRVNSHDWHAELETFNICLEKGGLGNLVCFRPLAADNPEERPNMPPEKIKAKYFAGTQKTCQ